MNNKQRKLINVSCKIEKLMIDVKNTKVFNKTRTYDTLTICLENYNLDCNFLTKLIQLLNKEQVDFQLIYDNSFKLKIY